MIIKVTVPLQPTPTSSHSNSTIAFSYGMRVHKWMLANNLSDDCITHMMCDADMSKNTMDITLYFKNEQDAMLFKLAWG